VHWRNITRLHSYLGDVPPAELEAAFYAAHPTARPGSETNSPSLHQSQGGSDRVMRAPAVVMSRRTVPGFQSSD
jgi:hypothetical protein